MIFYGIKQDFLSNQTRFDKKYKDVLNPWARFATFCGPPPATIAR
jgi:hypothetical protein